MDVDAADVTPSTASIHLRRLKERRLVKVFPQGRHRFYSLGGPEVASALEALSVLTAGSVADFVPRTPERLRTARTCYDHMAGALGVSLLERFEANRWLTGPGSDRAYGLTSAGRRGFEELGIDLAAALAARRRFAFACIDWSERRPHLGGALGAAVLDVALRRKWVRRELDSRVLEITERGGREMRESLGVLSPTSTSTL